MLQNVILRILFAMFLCIFTSQLHSMNFFKRKLTKKTAPTPIALDESTKSKDSLLDQVEKYIDQLQQESDSKLKAEIITANKLAKKGKKKLQLKKQDKIFKRILFNHDKLPDKRLMNITLKYIVNWGAHIETFTSFIFDPSTYPKLIQLQNLLS